MTDRCPSCGASLAENHIGDAVCVCGHVTTDGGQPAENPHDAAMARLAGLDPDGRSAWQIKDQNIAELEHELAEDTRWILHNAVDKHRIAALEAAATRKDVEIEAWRSGRLRRQPTEHEDSGGVYTGFTYAVENGYYDTIDAAVDALEE